MKIVKFWDQKLIYDKIIIYRPVTPKEVSDVTLYLTTELLFKGLRYKPKFNTYKYTDAVINVYPNDPKIDEIIAQFNNEHKFIGDLLNAKGRIINEITKTLRKIGIKNLNLMTISTITLKSVNLNKKSQKSLNSIDINELTYIFNIYIFVLRIGDYMADSIGELDSQHHIYTVNPKYAKKEDTESIDLTAIDYTNREEVELFINTIMSNARPKEIEAVVDNILREANSMMEEEESIPIWSVINIIEKHAQKIQMDRLNERIDNLDNNIQSFNNDVNNKIENLDINIQDLNNDVNNKIQDLNNKLDKILKFMSEKL